MRATVDRRLGVRDGDSCRSLGHNRVGGRRLHALVVASSLAEVVSGLEALALGRNHALS